MNWPGMEDPKIETDDAMASANPNNIPAIIALKGFQPPKIIAAKPMYPLPAVMPSSNLPTEPNEK